MGKKEDKEGKQELIQGHIEPRGCCHKCIKVLLRWSNIVLLLLGLAVTSYGAYLAIKGGELSAQSGMYGKHVL